MEDIASKAVVAVLTALVTIPLTAWLSTRRFYSEKWWERKLEAYLALIEALHHLSLPFDQAIEAMIEHRELPKDKQDAYWAKHAEAEAEIMKQIDMSELLISPQAVQLLHNMFKSSSAAKADTDWVGYVTHNQKAISVCINNLKPLAMADLKLVRNSWYPWR
jgi:hypothetical protein